MPRKPLLLLIVDLPDRPSRHYLLSATTISLGRTEGNAIVVDESAVSGRHCELRRSSSGGYEVVDLGSTNGTRLNGERIDSTPRELFDGDVLLLGVEAKARFVRAHEIRDRLAHNPAAAGGATMRLELPTINPVAAAVAKAAKTGGK